MDCVLQSTCLSDQHGDKPKNFQKSEFGLSIGNDRDSQFCTGRNFSKLEAVGLEKLQITDLTWDCREACCYRDALLLSAKSSFQKNEWPFLYVNYSLYLFVNKSKRIIRRAIR
jgi:hypothetical protein